MCNMQCISEKALLRCAWAFEIMTILVLKSKIYGTTLIIAQNKFSNERLA